MSLLTSTNINEFTGCFAEHFDLFSSGKLLIVHKEPKIVVTNTSANVYAGYGGLSNESNTTYIPVSGGFPAVRLYGKENEEILKSLNTSFPHGACRIKVKEDARNFINNGKNEKFELENLTFNGALEETPQNFLGLVYYRFTLYKTQ